MIYKDLQSEDNKSYDFELLNEISLLFSDIILPEIKNSYKTEISDNRLDSFLIDIKKLVERCLEHFKIRSLISNRKQTSKVLEH